LKQTKESQYLSIVFGGWLCIYFYLLNIYFKKTKKPIERKRRLT